MTPAARVNAAIALLDEILDGAPAEPQLIRWARSNRYAGSSDRAAVRDLVFEGLRKRNSLAVLGGAMTGRGLMLGLARLNGADLALLFSGTGYGPAAVSPDEQPGEARAIDLPDWIVPLWRASLGDTADDLAAQMAGRAPVWLRVNLLRTTPEAAMVALRDEGIEARPSDLLGSALEVLAGERRIALSKPYLDGRVELQDLSPQLACAAVAVSSGDRILDYCAGGGGKLLAFAMRARGLRLFAHDSDPARMSDLPARAARASVTIESMGKPAGQYDVVIADVPCSGSGTWRRTPDAKWRLNPQRLDGLINLQREILQEAAGFVAEGGTLVYMTCSVLRDENEHQISTFCHDNQSFSINSQQHWSPLNASDGFYLAQLKCRV